MPKDQKDTRIRIFNYRISRLVLIGTALIAVLLMSWTLYKLLWKKSEEAKIVKIEDENEEEKPKDTTSLEPAEDEEFFEFLDYDSEKIMKLIVPEGTTFKEGTSNDTKWFIGDYGKSEIRGHVNTTPLDINGDCNKYTEKFLSHLGDSGDGYVKYTHKNGAVACVWEGYDTDMGVYVEEFYIVNYEVEYNLVVTNPVNEDTEKSAKKIKIRARGVLDVGDLELRIFDGFESGDMAAWTMFI
ncbi:hypothetical protein JW766_01615 [Candidatus Dojkabacteria bacterium]|nr:hypothetical protein [Candidatus Dojkabacteria bacterium]